MDRFLIRKRPREEDSGTDGASAAAAGTRPPACVISWNANSIKLRAERKELGKAVKFFLSQGCEALMVQETRVLPDDKAACEQAMREAGLNDHLFLWGMHPGNKRYSGTLMVTPRACKPLSVRTSITDLCDPALRYAQQRPGATGNGSAKWEDPEQEGRVVLAEYHQCWLMCVYVPNCSWFAPGRQKRADWDARFASALQALQKGLPARGPGRPAVTGRPVVVVGDLNVCPTPLDVSDPTFFANAFKPRNVGMQDPGLQGQPGYTVEERERFASLLLGQCELVDTFRALHPKDVRLTWGWAPSFEVGRYANRYMGLDFVMVSRSLWDQGVVLASECLGGSAERCFGSDHAAVMARLDWSKVAAQGEAAQQDQDAGRGKDQGAAAVAQQQPGKELQGEVQAAGQADGDGREQSGAGCSAGPPAAGGTSEQQAHEQDGGGPSDAG